jgi:hypothetical protein
MNHPIACLVVLTLGISSCAKLVVEKVPPSGAVPADGVFYALPTTVVRLQLKLDRTVREGAEFVYYAPIFAPEGKPVCAAPKCTDKEEIEYSLEDDIGITTRGVPDPNQVYLVKFSGGGAIDQNLAVSWNEEGLLSAASGTVTNRASDIAMSGLKLAASLGTKGAFGAAALKVTEKGKNTGAEKCEVNGLATDEPFIATFRGINANAAEDLIENFCANSQRASLAYHADLLARATRSYEKRVVPLVTARRKILEGTSALSDPATLLPAIEAELGQQLAKLFLGTRSVKTWDGTLEVAGIVESRKEFDVLRIDGGAGFCIGKDASAPPEGKPYPEKFTAPPRDAKCDSPTTRVTLSWDYYPKMEDQLFNRIDLTETGERSFRYRMPAQVAVSLLIEDTSGSGKKVSKGGAKLSIAQLGKVVSLPAARHSKSLTYDLAFIEATGALKSFKLGTTGGFDAGTVDALSDVSGTVLDAGAARKAKRATEQDELTVLTREKSLLELRDAICTLKQKYGQTCDDQPK